MYKILSFLHKLTGCLLCVLFFMWFASGIVMIYHGFPRASADNLAANRYLLGLRVWEKDCSFASD